MKNVKTVAFLPFPQKLFTNPTFNIILYNPLFVFVLRNLKTSDVLYSLFAFKIPPLSVAVLLITADVT